MLESAVGSSRDPLPSSAPFSFNVSRSDDEGIAASMVLEFERGLDRRTGFADKS